MGADERMDDREPAGERAAEAMAAAEREAAAYLERAKRRADNIVTAAAAAAAAGSAGTGGHAGSAEVAEARRVAEAMVTERQRRLAALSDGISTRAAALTAGMDDAARIREQFDSFVESLSRTADRIAAEYGEGAEVLELSEPSEPEGIAA